MGIYKRLPRSRVKQTDEFISWTQHTIHWIEINWRIVLAGIGSLAVIVTLILIVSNYMGDKDVKARELLYQAERTAVDVAIPAFEKVFQDYPRSGAAKVARLKLGDIFYARGDYAKAEEVWRPLVDVRNPAIRILGLHNIAAAKSASGKKEEAAEIYLKAYSDRSNPVKDESYFNAALAYEDAGKIDDAKKIFEEIVNSESATPDLKQKSGDHLIWLATRK